METYMNARAEGVSEKVGIAIGEQFGRIWGIENHLLKLIKYSPIEGYVKFESRYSPVDRTSEAFVLRKAPKTIVERSLQWEGSDLDTVWDADIHYTNPDNDMKIGFDYDDSDKPNVKHVSISCYIPTPKEVLGGPAFARMNLGKDFRPKSVSLQFLDKNGLLADKEEGDLGYVRKFNPAAHLEFTKKELVEIFVNNNETKKMEQKGSFPKGELFRLPNTDYGYKVTHENGEWTFCQYDLSQKEPKLLKQIRIKDLSMEDVNSCLKGDLKAWSSLPDRIFPSGIINN